MRCPCRWHKCKQMAENYTFYRFRLHYSLITQLISDYYAHNILSDCHYSDEINYLLNAFKKKLLLPPGFSVLPTALPLETIITLDPCLIWPNLDLLPLLMSIQAKDMGVQRYWCLTISGKVWEGNQFQSQSYMSQVV